MKCYKFLKEATWIWPKFSTYLFNAYAGFRYDFNQENLPSNAPFLITADQAYKLYVNGQYVCRGPMRGMQYNWYYDTVDILKYLKTGHNWIAIEAHNPGCSTFSYHHKDAAGVICSCQWDNGIKIASNGKDWKIFRNTAYNNNTAQLSSQLGKMEEIDLRYDDKSWIYQEYDYNLPPEMRGMYCIEKQQGALPWSNLSARPIPLLQETYITPKKITASGKGKCAVKKETAPGIIPNIVADFVDYEFDTLKYDDKPLEFKFNDNAIAFSIPQSSKGNFSFITIDIGKDSWLPGVPVLELENSQENVIIDILYHHYLPEDKITYFQHPQEGSMISLASRIHLGKNSKKIDLFQIMGTRYATLIVRENNIPLNIKFYWRSAVYPMDIKGNFACSDPIINSIYQTCVHTQQVCSMDAFVDTPWREQSQWWGDARVQAKNTIFLTGNCDLLANGLKSIAAQSNPVGLTYANAPTKYSGQILPDFALTWIITLRDLWFQTGNKDHLSLLKEQADKILAYFESIKNKDGLIKYDKRFWLFEDWSNLPKQNIPTFLNLWYIYAEEKYLELLEVSEYKEEALVLKEKIKKEKEIAEKRFFDPTQKLFLPEQDDNGNLIGEPSVHDQVLAILLGLCPEYKENMLTKVIIPCLAGTLKQGAQPSAFWATYLLDCAFECNLIKEAISYIKRLWKPMLDAGTVWENFLDTPGRELSCSHAWSAHIVSHLPELIFGIKQLKENWSELSLKIEFIFEDASFKIPLPQGLLSCTIKGTKENYALTIEVPKNVKAIITLPDEIIIASGETIVR